MDKKYDVIVVGAGPGGYVCAIKAAQEGLKTLIVEKEYFGGVCLNIGCIPTKTLMKGAKVYESIRHAGMYGVDIGDLEKIVPNWVKMQQRKADVVKKLTSGVEFLLKKNKAEIVKGQAKAIDKNTIEVNGTRYSAKNLIIATGSEPRLLPNVNAEAAFKEGFVITSTEALALPKIPKEIVVIGGGVIGIEFAWLYNALGSKVTVLEAFDSILGLLDDDVKVEMTKILKKSGIEIHTNVRVEKIENKTVYYSIDNQKGQVSGEYCLMSVGRKPIITGFENIGLNLGKIGNIEVNDKCQTNLDGVYAIGDVTGRAMLAHVASAQGLVAINNILGHNDTIDYNKIPSCVYTHPEIAMVGKTEKQLKEAKVEYKAFKFPLSANGKALGDGETDGFVKILCEPKYGEILGAHIICATATDMISEITLCMESEATIHEIAKAIHPHPSISEAIAEVAHGLEEGKAIHI